MIVIIDETVIRRLKPVVAERLVAGRDRGIKKLIVSFAFLAVVIECLEGIAAAHGSSKIDVIGENPDELVDDRTRNFLFQRGLVKRIVKPHASLIIGIVAFARARLLGRAMGRSYLDITAVVIDRDVCFQGLTGINRKARQGHIGAGTIEIGEEKLEACSLRYRGMAERDPEGGKDPGDLIPCDSGAAQHALECFAVTDHDETLLHLRCGRNLRRPADIGHVFRNHADFDRGKRSRRDRLRGIGIGKNGRKISTGRPHQKKLRRQGQWFCARFQRVFELFGDLGLNLFHR